MAMAMGGMGTSSYYYMQRDVFDFGKYRGNKHIDNVDDDDDGTLEWMGNTFFSSQVKRNVYDVVSELKACTRKRELQKGRQVHRKAVETGIGSNKYVEAALINMYAKCGSMKEARSVFDSIHKPDVVSWTALLLGYADNGQGLNSLELFLRMKNDCMCTPNSMTYVAAIKACTSLAGNRDGNGQKRCLEEGREIHLEIGCHMDQFLQNTLIDMYAKCGSMEEARIVFDSIQKPDVVSWNAVILGYSECGQGSIALHLFSRMKDECRCAPNSVTYLAVLKACTSLAADGDGSEKRECLQLGREIHMQIGFHRSQFVHNALIDMYAKCGSMEEARIVFDSIQKPDVVSWNAVILGYAECGQGSVALDLFWRMKEQCSSLFSPNSVTYLAALKACDSIGALAIGRKIHYEIKEFSAHIVTCLVDFYGKCGSMKEARHVFDLYPRARVVLTWNVMLAGYSRSGEIDSVFMIFQGMKDEGFVPNAATFVCMLVCCSHAGLVEKAWEYIEAMPVVYGVTPSVMHYNCMIDLLGRANKLEEGVDLVEKMPCKPDSVTWMTLLGACRKWENVEIGSLAFKCLVDLDECKVASASAYVLMAEIYGSRGMWEEQERVVVEAQAAAMASHSNRIFEDQGIGGDELKER